jgi:transcriptional regulator with XRE-family HTH domain
MARQSYTTLRNRLTPEQRQQSEVQARQHMADMLLAEIRREVGLTQEQLAEAMGITQPTLSKHESQSDMQISTLQRLVSALGGELEIVAHLPRGDVRITQFREPQHST